MDFPSSDGAITFASSCASNSSEAESVRNSSNPQTIFASNGKVFETGQVWSYCGGLHDFPLYYGRIQKITATVALGQEEKYKLHVSRLMPTRFPIDVIQWDEKKMPVGCGTFYPRKALEIITPEDVSQEIVPQTSLDGNEYTILPKTGEVWVIYKFWHQYMEFEMVGFCGYAIVEILDDTLDYKVMLLEHQSFHGDDKAKYRLFREVKEFTYSGEEDWSEPIFTIPKSERLRFSHKVPARRVTREIYGEIKDLIEVDVGALPSNLRFSDF